MSETSYNSIFDAAILPTTLIFTLMKKYILLFSLSCFLFASCENSGGEPVAETPENPETTVSEPTDIELTAEDEAIMASDGQDFALKFFATVCDNEEEEENIFLSPFGLSMALGILRNGAEGDTKREIQEVLGMKDFSDQQVNAYYKKMKDLLITVDPTLQLAIANSIWYNKNLFTIKSDFSDLSKTWFDAQITGLNYSPMTEAAAIVNRWCEDNTSGLIKDMVEKLTEVEILNALYFKGDWSDGHGFDASKTAEQDFTRADGSKVKVNMMYNGLSLPCYSDDYLSFISIPYGNEAYSMYFILPAENVAFSEMTAQLAVPGYWAQCIAARSAEIVYLSVPKFKMEYKHNKLTDILSKMGMATACSSLASYPDIVDNMNFKIGGIAQKTYIRVDEKGTEAAAVTEIMMVESHIPNIFHANRPFLFLIQEHSTGTILFMGKAGNPAE
jgi:serpin B